MREVFFLESNRKKVTSMAIFGLFRPDSDRNEIVGGGG